MDTDTDEYVMIARDIWQDPKFKKLSTAGKALWFWAICQADPTPGSYFQSPMPARIGMDVVVREFALGELMGAGWLADRGGFFLATERLLGYLAPEKDPISD